MITWPAKDPAELLDYTWVPPVDEGDTISGHTATVLSGTATIDSSAVQSGSVRVWIEGGADSETATFNLTVTTTGGRTFREVAVLPIFDRANEMLALFRLRFPLLATSTDGDVGYWLLAAAAHVDDTWGTSADVGKLLYAAHMIEANKVSEIPAGVTNFRSGSLSVTYANDHASRVGFEATAYGREFVALRRALIGGARVTPTGTVGTYVPGWS